MEQLFVKVAEDKTYRPTICDKNVVQRIQLFLAIDDLRRYSHFEEVTENEWINERNLRHL